MDQQLITLEGCITGQKTYYDCPMEIRLFGPNEPDQRESLVQRMRADKLPIGHAMDRTRKEAKAEKERQKLAAQAAKLAKKNGGAVVGSGQGIDFDNPLGVYAGGSSQGFSPGPSLEDIIGGSTRFNPRHAERAVEEFGIKEEDLVSSPSQVSVYSC